MFKTWLQKNPVSKNLFTEPLFPPASDRAFWSSVLSNEYITLAEAQRTTEWPIIRATQYMEYQKSGDRQAQETPHFARRRKLKTLILGELAQYEGKYLPEICDGVFLVCEETFWGISAHMDRAKNSHFLPAFSDPYIDLFAAETAEILAVIYSLFYDELNAFCPEILSRVEYEIQRRIITPYLSNKDFSWMGYHKAPNNWNPWIISNLLTVFLSMPIDEMLFRKGLEKMFVEINHYYAAMPDDGGCDEGCYYWEKAGGEVFTFCNQLSIASGGKVDLFGNKKLYNIIHYIVKAHISGNYFVNFADGNARINVVSPAIYGFGLRSGDKEFCRFAATLTKRLHKDVTLPDEGSMKDLLFPLIYSKAMDKEECFEPRDKYVLPDLQNAFLRSGSWYCATKGGHNEESHNHNDVGNIIVFEDGNPVLIDVGCGVYTKSTFSEKRYEIWTMQSGYHNLPVLNGFEQLNGKSYRADRFEVVDKTAEVSFANAYPREAGVLSAVRSVTASADGITIQDKFAFCGNKNTFEEHLLTLLPVKETEQGLILGEKYLLETDLPAKIQWKDFDGDKKLVSVWGTEGVSRVKFYGDSGKYATVNIKIRKL